MTPPPIAIFLPSRDHRERFPLPLCLLLLSTIALAQTSTADEAAATGVITGTVTDAVTHLPVKKAVVSINPLMGGGMGSTRRTQGSSATTTDASGSFTLSNLQAGQYRMTFQQQSYPQARFGGVFKTVEVKASQTTPPVNVELIPGGAISGRIVDEDGDPLPNCGVQLHPAKNPQQGVNMLGPSASNPEGEYRASGIAAGKYIVSAHCGQALFQPRPFSSGPDAPPSRAYPMLYYPLTTEAKSADIIELTPGNEKSGVDFQMKPAPVTQVRGAFAPGSADWHGSNLQLALMSPDLPFGNTWAPVDQAKGTFEFRQVFAGSYTLTAFNNGNEGNWIGAFQRVDVRDKPVELTLELKHGIDIAGKVEIESSGNTTNPIVPSQIQLTLRAQNQMGMQQQQTQVNADGTFTIKSVLPGIWRLQANGPSMFVKSAWLGSTDVTDVPIDLSGGGAAEAMKIVISTNTATIRGSAAAGSTIFAQRSDEQFNRAAQSDQNGQYRLEGLAPGKYRLMLQESGGGPIPDEGGQEVTIKEGETAMIDLKPNP